MDTNYDGDSPYRDRRPRLRDHTPGELDVSPGGMRRLTTDEGLDAEGYPVMPSPADRRTRWA